MDDDFDDDDGGEELRITIEPRDEALEALGIDIDAFEEALEPAIDRFHKMIDGLDDAEDAPPIEDMPVRIGDRSYRLGDLADVSIAEAGEFDESE